MEKTKKWSEILCGVIVASVAWIGSGAEAVQRHSVEEGNRMLETMMSGAKEKTTF